MNIPPCLLNKDCSCNRDLRVYHDIVWIIDQKNWALKWNSCCTDLGISLKVKIFIFWFSRHQNLSKNFCKKTITMVSFLSTLSHCLKISHISIIIGSAPLYSIQRFATLMTAIPTIIIVWEWLKTHHCHWQKSIIVVWEGIHVAHLWQRPSNIWTEHCYLNLKKLHCK